MKIQTMSPTRWVMGFGVFCLGVALVASPASAQQGGRQGGRGFGGGFGGGAGAGGRTFYLANEQVRTELKITDDQKSKIDEVSRKLREETSALVPRDLSREEAQKKREETADQRRKLSSDAEAKIDEILTADQKKRLDEIVLQQQGNRALTTEKMVASLGLSAEQKTKIETALEDQGKKQRELFQGGGQGGGREAFAANREKMEKLREETNATIAGILTSEQKAKLDELKGKEFKMEFRGFGGGQGGPGGGGRGNRRPGGNNN